MPPKKSIKSVGKQKMNSKERQTSLLKGQMVVEKEQKHVIKSKSKQFSDSSNLKEIKNSVNLWKYGSGETPDKLLISSWNVNGIRAVISKNDLKKYLQSKKPDIICINETKINQQAFKKSEIKFDGYEGYWNFCKCSAGYSGVAIFTKYLPLKITQDLPEKEHSQQGRVITMEFQKFYLITAYIPNSGQKLDRLNYRVSEYDSSFQNHCQNLRKKKMVIICGDLNVCHKQIDIAKPKGNEKTAGFTIQQRQSFTKFLNNGWIDTFRKLYPTEVKYSWWSMRTGGRSKNIGWRLDYFLINQQSIKCLKDSQINNDIMGSDHCPIELSLNLN